MFHFSSLSRRLVLDDMKKSIPVLSNQTHKGQAGRIGVFGGSLEYTGAPYFAAMAALRTGCDLVHIFCRSEAAPVLKSYSPELIVHPLLDSSNAVEEILEWLPRLHAVVIGPGLGRDKHVFKLLGDILNKAKLQEIPIVIDADGLFYVNQCQEEIRGNRKVVLTPNAMEFSRLYQAIRGINIPPSTDPNPEDVKGIAMDLGHVTILHKGNVDVITNGIDTFLCEELGSPRRCGGQGDLLSGSLATFLHWSFSRRDSVYPTLASAYSACCLAKGINKKAFEKFKRSTLATDMIPYIQQEFEELFDQN